MGKNIFVILKTLEVAARSAIVTVQEGGYFIVALYASVCHLISEEFIFL